MNFFGIKPRNRYGIDALFMSFRAMSKKTGISEDAQKAKQRYIIIGGILFTLGTMSISAIMPSMTVLAASNKVTPIENGAAGGSMWSKMNVYAKSSNKKDAQ